MRQIHRARGVTERAERGQPLGAAGEQKAVLEKLPLGELQQSQRKGENCGVETAGKKARYKFLARSFLDDIERDVGRRALQTLQQPRKQVGRERGDNPDGEPERACLETLAHCLQEQRFVQDPERLLVRFPPERVRRTPRLSRSNRGAPTVASSSRIWSESAGCET